MIEIHIVETPGLGNRTYVAADGRSALVVDPPRDYGRVLDLLREKGLRLTHVLETHVHNDYVTGGAALAAEAGAEYVVNAAEGLAHPHRGVADGDVLAVGHLRVGVMAAPGHTQHHLAYVLATAEGEVIGVFTGGSLLYGTTGRTDLMGDHLTEWLTRCQWRTARRIAGSVPGYGEVWPTHGFGSLCSGGAGSGAASSTVDDERRGNPVFLLEENVYASTLIAGLGAYPSYYRHMGAANRSGPGPLDAGPVPLVDEATACGALAAGRWVVDLRPRRAFAARHLPGALNVEAGPALATYVGWVVPWEEPVTLVGSSARELEDARVSLGRIGMTVAAGHVSAGPSGPLAAPCRPTPGVYAVATFADLLQRRAAGCPLSILDVREPREHRYGHLEGALNIPFHQLAERADEVPPAKLVWVHCAAGFRAALAASLLERLGRRPILVDDRWAEVARHPDQTVVQAGAAA